MDTVIPLFSIRLEEKYYKLGIFCSVCLFVFFFLKKAGVKASFLAKLNMTEVTVIFLRFNLF